VRFFAFVFFQFGIDVIRHLDSCVPCQFHDLFRIGICSRLPSDVCPTKTVQAESPGFDAKVICNLRNPVLEIARMAGKDSRSKLA